MSFRAQDVPPLTGKTVIVTGANSGIGFEAARVFAERGADLIMACRSSERGHAAAERIRSALPEAHIEVRPLDLASLAAVREFARWFNDSRGALHLLINNAGLMAIPRQTTVEGFEMQLGVNHLAHFALTGLVLPKLLETPGARVVNLSSQAHLIGRMRWDDLDGQRSYYKWTAYGQSKLANLLFTFELARRLNARHATQRALACHPGYAATNLQLVGPRMEGSRLGLTMMKIGNQVLAQSAADGALPTLYAATAPAAQSGEYIGPGGLFGRAGAPAPLRAMAAAYEPMAMQRLWQVSIERTGVSFSELG
jgi:NAD(P)-dependent dehydrogenase (short-subunit alcohol dehydrogenase family)